MLPKDSTEWDFASRDINYNARFPVPTTTSERNNGPRKFGPGGWRAAGLEDVRASGRRQALAVRALAHCADLHNWEHPPLIGPLAPPASHRPVTLKDKTANMYSATEIAGIAKVIALTSYIPQVRPRAPGPHRPATWSEPLRSRLSSAPARAGLPHSRRAAATGRGLYASPACRPGAAYHGRCTSSSTLHPSRRPLQRQDDFSKRSEQYKFFERELRSVNRRRTPWLVVLMHAAMYASFSKHYKEVECMRATYEPLMAEHGVDIVLSGHNHA